jgi:Raf kinase inhibitor-like YbhB/YbcL family protein
VSFKVVVEGFSEAAGIPERYTCDGADRSPALHWSAEPAGTQSFALIMDDPDAPGGVFTHWLVWDIPAYVHSLPEGNEHASLGKAGLNDFGKRGYGGPCPPKARGPHRYFYRVFALDAPSLDLPEGSRRAALEKAVRKHALAEASFMGRYERH